MKKYFGLAEKKDKKVFALHKKVDICKIIFLTFVEKIVGYLLNEKIKQVAA